MTQERKEHIAKIVGIECTLAFDLARMIDILMFNILAKMRQFDGTFFREQKKKYNEFTAQVDKIISLYDKVFDKEDWDFANHNPQELDSHRAQQNEYIRLLLLYIDRVSQSDANYKELFRVLCEMEGENFITMDDLKPFIMAKPIHDETVRKED